MDSRTTIFREVPQEKVRRIIIKKAIPCHRLNEVFLFFEAEDSFL